MSRKKRDQLKKSNFLVVKNNLDKTQDRIIFPKDVQVGIDNIDKGSVLVTGRIIGKTGISGSLTRLSDGRSYIVAGDNITITSSSNGQIIIEGTGGAGSGDISSVTAGDGLTGGGTTGAVTLNVGAGTGINVASDEISFDADGGATVTSIADVDHLLVNDAGTLRKIAPGNLQLGDFGNTSNVSIFGNLHLSGSVSEFVATGSARFNVGLSGSLTQLTDGTSYLIAGSNVAITTASNGSVTISSTGGGGGGSISVVSGSTSVSTVSTIAATDGFILNDEGSGRAGLTSSIGVAEDGDYTDGLFTDFTSQTRIGVAIDRFNEILKLLAPSPAPDLDDIDVNVDGTDAYLSFGSSNDLESEGTPYFSVGTGAGLSAVDVNGLYETAASGNNLRASIFNGSTNITGDLNEDISADGSNYPANSFGNADQGTLKLEVNGATIHTVDLTTFTGTGDPGSGTGVTESTGSCFTNFSTAAEGTLDNGTSFPNFKHRTGRYKVLSSDQRQGWNYARVIHTYGSTTLTTNYVEWVNDSDANALAAAGNGIEFTGGSTIHLSGIEYFTNGTAEYKVRVSNAYRNVYDLNNISFTTSTGGSLNSGASFSLSSQSKPTIDTGAGEDHTKVLHLTSSNSVTANYMLNGSVTAGVSVTHPFKSNLSNSGQSTTSGILIYNLSNNSDNQNETFRRENFRIISASYDTQASLTDSGNVWNSERHITGSNAGHSDGLQFYGERLYSPINTLNSGDFRNTADGGSLDNGPGENPNYSGITDVCTFYRWFRNETGSTKHDFSLTINGSGTTIVNSGGTLNSTNIKVFVKFPNNGTRETGWLDLAKEFVLDSYEDNKGAHTANGSLTFDSTLNATNYVTLGTIGIGDDEYIGFKIVADASWTGYISDISVTFGGGTGTISAVPDLDDIDCNNDGIDCNLSFGSSKSITGYTNVGTTAGFTATDVNGLYQTSASGNNLRRSVFTLSTNIEGDLNEDVDAVSPDYVANSFSDANSGSLKLEVNGAVIHQLEITGAYDLVGSGNPGSGTGTHVNSNGSGFINLSTWSPAEFDNDVPYYLEIYRTGRYRVHTNDQRNGWNYARVIHTIDGVDRNTNYVEWVNDSDSSSLSIAGLTLKPFYDEEVFNLSGVKYFVQPSGSIEVRVSNIYKNVYSDSSSAISFNNLTNATGVTIIQQGDGLSSTKTTNASIDSLQTLNTSTDSQNEVLNVTGSIRFSLTGSLSGSYANYTRHAATGSLAFDHPFKSNIDTHSTLVLTSSVLLVYTSSDSSNANTLENFTGELFRLQSGSFDTQSDVTKSAYNWSSSGSLNDNSSFPGYYTGMMIFDKKMISPIDGGNSGDFRNYSDGGVFDGPDGNVNYSSLGENVREYYRGFLNNTSNDLARVTIVLYGDATLVGKSGANVGTLGENKNIFVELSIPGKTEFLDLGKPSAGAGNTNEGDGCLFGDLTPTINLTGATNVCTFNGETVNGTSSGAEYFIIKISAHKDWTGYISQISVTWSG